MFKQFKQANDYHNHTYMHTHTCAYMCWVTRNMNMLHHSTSSVTPTKKTKDNLTTNPKTLHPILSILLHVSQYTILLLYFMFTLLTAG